MPFFCRGVQHSKCPKFGKMRGNSRLSCPFLLNCMHALFSIINTVWSPNFSNICQVFFIISVAQVPEIKFSEQSRSYCSFLNQKNYSFFLDLWNTCIYFYVDIVDMLAALKPLQLIYILHFINIGILGKTTITEKSICF